VEGRAIDSANSANVLKFLLEDVICRYGCPRSIVMDGGAENLDLTQELIIRYKVRNLRISAYLLLARTVSRGVPKDVQRGLNAWRKKDGNDGYVLIVCEALGPRL
jgi:hypothetical protein